MSVQIYRKGASRKGASRNASTTTAACANDQDIDPVPLLDDPRHHCLDVLVIADIDLDPPRVPPTVSISATVLSAVMSFASASNSSYERRLRSATVSSRLLPASSGVPRGPEP